MSIQDDIFDVRDALKKKAEKESFERIMKVFYRLEEDSIALDKLCDGLGDVRTVLNARYKGDE